MLILSKSKAIAGVSAETPTPKLFVEPQTYTATQLGEVFTININITNIHNLTSFEFKLSYNTTLLDALEAVEGSLPQPPTNLQVAIHDPEGYLWIIFWCGPSEGNGTLVKITFNATYAEPSSCALHLYDTELADTQGSLIPHEVEDGNYTFAILNITVATNKPFYQIGEETVEISGNLTLNNSPHEGFVALEVVDPDRAIVVRTLQTGSDLPCPPGNITIVDLFSCNNWGIPKETFQKGQLAYFYVAVRNNGTEPKSVIITVNAYDNNMVPLPPVQKQEIIPLLPGTQADMVAGIPIPNWAATGTGKVYASALTLMPKYGGVPYCPEASATFNITAGGGAPGEQGSENIGSYNLTFKLTINNAKVGNYTVYATSSYLGTTTSILATKQTTFEVELLGDINGDGKITSTDVTILNSLLTKIMLELMTMEEALAQYPSADLNDDGKITGTDATILNSILTKIMLGLPLT